MSEVAAVVLEINVIYFFVALSNTAARVLVANSRLIINNTFRVKLAKAATSADCTSVRNTSGAFTEVATTFIVLHHAVGVKHTAHAGLDWYWNWLIRLWGLSHQISINPASWSRAIRIASHKSFVRFIKFISAC